MKIIIFLLLVAFTANLNAAEFDNNLKLNAQNKAMSNTNATQNKKNNSNSPDLKTATLQNNNNNSTINNINNIDQANQNNQQNNDIPKYSNAESNQLIQKLNPQIEKIDNRETDKIEVSDLHKRKPMKSIISIEIKDAKDSKKGLRDSFIKEAYEALKASSPEVALFYYQKVLKLNDKDIDALFGAAVCYQILFQNNQAIAYYKKIIQYKQNKLLDDRIVNNFMVAVANKNINEAKDMLLFLNKSIPNNAFVLGQLGVTYLKMNEIDNAILFLKQAFEFASEKASHAYNLGVAYDLQNKTDYAKYYYNYALDNGFSKEKDQDALQKLKDRVGQLNGNSTSNTKPVINN